MPTSNQFAQFAAGSKAGISSSDGWLKTKRRGRDDEQIENDAKTASEAKKKRNQRGRTAAKASTSKKPTSRAKAIKGKQKSTYESDENDSFIDSDESLEILESDEEEEDFQLESDEDEEDLDLPEDDDMSDSIVDSESSPEKKARKSTKKTAGRIQISARAVNRGRARGSAKAIIELDSSSDEDDDIFEVTENKKPTKSANVRQMKGKSMSMNLSSSDDESDEPQSKSLAKAKPKTSRDKSKYFQKKERDSDLEMASPTIIHAKNKTSKRKQHFSDSDDDIIPSTKKFNPIKSTSDVGVAGLSDTDDDEALHETIALSKALELSRKEEETKQKKAMEQFPSVSKVIYKEDPKTDDEEDEEDAVEEMEYFVDEKELEASSVLDAANNLSARIVSEMANWFESGGASSGLIVDGAIAMSSLKMKEEKNSLAEEKKEDTNESKSVDDKWITSQEMERVCPQLTLKDYQLIGVNWMALLNRSTFKMKGDCDKEKKKRRKGSAVNGVLADEMGLGKTAQTIAFLAWLKYRKTGVPANESDVIDLDSADEDVQLDGDSDYDDNHKPHIIIVPASVLDNWLREFEKFCPTMNVLKYHGSQAARQEIKSELRAYLPKKKGSSKWSKFQKRLDVVLTTFSYFSSEKSDDRGFLRKFDWNYMVVDEAHCLKNPKGKAYRNLDAFGTDRRLLLTGTPVQNSPKELMSLLCFLMPLFSREASNFDEDDNNDGGATMLEYFVRLEAVGKEKNNEVSQEEAYRKLKQLLAPFVLRRRKDEVLSRVLLPKHRQVEWVPFNEDVRKTYDSILATHLQSKLAKSASSSTHVFTSLRKAANHALLLRTRHTSPEAIQHLAKNFYSFGYFGRDATCTHSLVVKEISKFSDYDIHCAAAALIDENSHRSTDLARYLLQEDDLFCSPKFSRLKVLLPKLVNGGHRMLIFSQWTRCLDLLGCLMDAMGYRFLRLDGQTNIQTRQQLIDQFTTDTKIPVFLLSTRAGGMGINLTAADTCILHDLDFNPFNDIQAEDRVHRIGQHKPVTVIKMVTENTVDADIYKMQERKSEMNAAILETKSSAKQKREDTKEMNSILKNAVTRYQMS